MTTSPLQNSNSRAVVIVIALALIAQAVINALDALARAMVALVTLAAMGWLVVWVVRLIIRAARSAEGS